jgi:hypothetical protein
MESEKLRIQAGILSTNTQYLVVSLKTKQLVISWDLIEMKVVFYMATKRG